MKDLDNLNMRRYIVFTTVVSRIAQEFLLVACFFQCLNKTCDTKMESIYMKGNNFQFRI